MHLIGDDRRIRRSVLIYGYIRSTGEGKHYPRDESEYVAHGIFCADRNLMLPRGGQVLGEFVACSSTREADPKPRV